MTWQILGEWPPKGKKQAVLLNLVESHPPVHPPPKTPGTGDEERRRMIIGGSDGRVITIDDNGAIHVLPSGGPGDPEVKKAVASIASSIQVIVDAAMAGKESS